MNWAQSSYSQQSAGQRWLRSHFSTRPFSLPLLALVLLATSSALSTETSQQAGPVSATVRLSPENPRIGDPIILEIEAVAEPLVEVLMPDFGEALDRFSIRDFVPREGLDDQGNTVLSQRYTLDVSLSGEHTLPSILIEFIDRRPGRDPAPEGADAYELLTDPVTFQVESLVVDAAAADLSPPMGELSALGRGMRELWGWAAALVVVLAAATPFALRFLARSRAKALRKSAYDVARLELDGLLAGPRPRPEQVGEFFVKLSGVVRRYLESRFELRSPELTTEEFMALLSSSPELVREHQNLLRDFLQQADLVKFAHHIPSAEAIEEAISAAKRFLDETRQNAPLVELPPTDGSPAQGLG